MKDNSIDVIITDPTEFGNASLAFNGEYLVSSFMCKTKPEDIIFDKKYHVYVDGERINE